VLLYEIQQPSNVTFRLGDWGRVGASGMTRALHHREGLALVDPHSRPEPIPRVPLNVDGADRALLVATPYFALERIVLGNSVVDLAAVDSPQVLTPVAGAVTLNASGWVDTAATGETVILPAGQAATLATQSDGVMLRGWVPDLEHEIISPARAAGASEAALRNLGVPLGNVVGAGSPAASEPGARSRCNSC
jgi:mannose-6-phosphate isomerase class I